MMSGLIRSHEVVTLALHHLKTKANALGSAMRGQGVVDQLLIGIGQTAHLPHPELKSSQGLKHLVFPQVEVQDRA